MVKLSLAFIGPGVVRFTTLVASTANVIPAGRAVKLGRPPSRVGLSAGLALYLVVVLSACLAAGVRSATEVAVAVDGAMSSVVNSAGRSQA